MEISNNFQGSSLRVRGGLHSISLRAACPHVFSTGAWRVGEVVEVISLDEASSLRVRGGLGGNKKAIQRG